MTKNLRKFEEEWWSKDCYYIAGVDEAGRGPLAGPVVSAAVVFSDDIQIKNINDSKQLSPEEREELYHEIIEKALAVGVGYVDNVLIDKMNILQSTYLSMIRSIKKLNVMPDIVLVDGYPIPDFPIIQQGIIKGDAKSISIAAASIVAKVHRDRIMEFYGMEYPEYDFQSNKGYATKKHVEVVKTKGVCEIHRRTFSPIREMFERFFGENH